MNTEQKNELIRLFEQQFREKVDTFSMFPPSGSYREYGRLMNPRRSVVGVLNEDVKENTAFLAFTDHFRKNGLPVPQIYAVSSDLKKYLLEDLGDTTLFDFVSKTRESEGFSESIVEKYQKVLQVLPRFQIRGGKELDYSVCYPREAFDKQSMMWDLNYFKYYFLKLARIPFDEQALEDDFQVFSDFLLSASSGFFLYRDFQSRNVMLQDDDVYFIDYQGGRRGALQYDLASLLYDAKADIPPEIRTRLYRFYLAEIKKYMPVDEEAFSSYYNGFVIIRMMQAMGAFGFRGFYEKKEHFLQSIPYALKNLENLLSEMDLPVDLPELTHVLHLITRSEKLKAFGGDTRHLTVRITSFSFKRGIPEDPSGNGGGFVFDCRALNNPGRHPEFKDLTGKDLSVQTFLEEKSEVEGFLAASRMLIDQTVKNYLSRGFDHLSVSFGCTGGQHRSVYAAEKIAEYLRSNYPVNVVVVHREQ